MITRSLILLAALAFCAGTANSQTSRSRAEANVACPTFIQSDPMTPYGFARAQLAALWYARNSVRDALAEVKQAQDTEDAFASMTAMMRSTKVSTNDFVCAKQVVQPYASVKTHVTSATKEEAENIRTAARFAVMVYDQLIDINHRMLDLLRGLPTAATPAQLSDRISTLQVERGQRWADLATPTSMTLMMLIDARPTDADGNFIQTTDPAAGYTKRLVITRKQKQELLDYLDENFPELKDGTPEEQLPDPTKMAHLYLTLFEGRKCSDE